MTTENKNAVKKQKHDNLGNPVKDMSPYFQALFNVLDNCRDLVEYAEYKRGAIWIMYAAMKNLASTIRWMDQVPVIALDIGEHPERYKSTQQYEETCTYWDEQLHKVDSMMPCKRIWEEFSKVYDRLILDYTSDNLGNFDLTIPTSEEILRKTSTAKEQADVTQRKMCSESLKAHARLVQG